MIRLTIQRKVFLATFALATTMATLLVLFTRWNLEQGFERYTAAAEFSRLDWLIKNAEADYAAHGSWDFVRNDPREAWRHMQRLPGLSNANPGPASWQGGPPPQTDWRPPPPGMEWQPPPAGDWRPPPPGMGWQPPPPAADWRPPSAQGNGPGSGDLLGIGPRLALLDASGNVLAGNPVGVQAPAARPIRYNGEVVGQLTLQAAATSNSELGAAFLASQTRNLLLSGLAALVLSFLAAWWLARHFLAPVRDLADGARRIAGNKLDTRIPVRGDDELGKLAEDFNAMAEQLARAEEGRRAWISNSSHELRTPLAVLRAEIEALQDGIRVADSTTLERLLKQTQQLTKLVDDLRLTLDHDPVAAGLDGASIDPLAVLREVAAAFEKRYADAGIGLELALPAKPGWRIVGDADRLVQVFSNLLENTLRYTNRGGCLRIGAGSDGRHVNLQFDDTAPAPPKSALPRLFERFFRAEVSRSRAHGGSGLGLAICKTIVEAHEGDISAALSELGGLSIRIQLPLDGTQWSNAS